MSKELTVEALATSIRNLLRPGLVLSETGPVYEVYDVSLNRDANSVIVSLRPIGTPEVLSVLLVKVESVGVIEAKRNNESNI